MVNVEANLIAHALTAYAVGNSALAGASGAAMGEFIAQQMYPGAERSKLSEEQRQTISALGMLAAGLAGGVAADSTGSAVAGAQAGKNALENNNLIQLRPVQVPVPGLPMSPGDKVVQNANNKIASELDKALKGSGTGAGTLPITDGRAIVEARDEAAKSRDPNVAHNQQHQDGAGNRTETVPVDDDLTGGKLVNPAQDEKKGTSLVTPDQSGEQGSSNTGNTDGMPDTGGNTRATPIHEQNKDDLAYLAEGRDNRLPIPESTTASNGLKVESNTKHTPGAQGFRPDAGIEPRNSLELFENSVATRDPKIRLSIDQNGNIHRFYNANKDGSGIFHWSGSAGDAKNKLGNRELGSFNKEIKQLKGKS